MNHSIEVNHKLHLSKIDPSWAWEVWQPSPDEPWNRGRVSLLYRRAGFGATNAEIDRALKESPSEIIARLASAPHSAAEHVAEFESESDTIRRAVVASNSMPTLAAWWLHRMLHSPTPLLEKMTLFWHGHFATSAEKVQDAELMLNQNQYLRKHALERFQALVHGISKDPAMLIYLDSASNRKSHANENYARELMELFCLGEGNYTEHDVQELARCFTGWEIRRKQFRFNPYQHDNQTKTILNTSGIESGEEAIDCILSNPAMPKFIVRKLFRFFVCDEPAPPDSLLDPLVDLFAKLNFAILPVVQRMLGSRLLLSGWATGRKVRSPVELTLECMRCFQLTTNLEKLADKLKTLGHGVFYPPNVKGWDGGRAWINSSTLIGRANLIHDLVRDESTRFANLTLAKWCEQQGIRTQSAFLSLIEQTVLAKPLTANLRQQLQERMEQHPTDWARTLVEMSLLPAFHLS
jgi:uncharacterized protein (DUF1800 family)